MLLRDSPVGDNRPVHQGHFSFELAKGLQGTRGGEGIGYECGNAAAGIPGQGIVNVQTGCGGGGDDPFGPQKGHSYKMAF